MITNFAGEYAFLSNFYESHIFYGIRAEGGGPRMYPTVEHFFQAWKARNEYDHEYIRYQYTPGAAKRAGQRIRIRDNWEEVKEKVMAKGLELKFTPGSELAEMLLATGEIELVEGNNWGDRYWGCEWAVERREKWSVSGGPTGPEEIGAFYRDVFGWQGLNRLGVLLMAQRSNLLLWRYGN